MYHYANDIDQIKVYGTYNSIVESGNFFDRFIKNNIRYSIGLNKSSKNNFIEEDCIYVTGSMANQLFTPGLSYNKFRDGILDFKQDLDETTHDEYNKDLARMADISYKDILTDECLEFLSPSINKSPITINTLQDLRWYILFNYKWYDVLTNSLISLDKNRVSRIHAFFNTEDFQLWSIYNNDPVTKTGDYRDERWQLRETITEYTGDSYYSSHKKKFTSVLSRKPHNWLYLLNDYSNVYVKD